MTHPVEAYLSHLAPSTRRVALGDLRSASAIAWPQFTGLAAGDDQWVHLDAETCGRIRSALASRYAPATARRMLSCVRGVVRASWRLGALSWDAHVRLLACLSPVRGERLGKGRSLTWPEVGRLLEAAQDTEERALLALAVGGGLRRAELCGARTDHVEVLPSAWYIRVRGKGNKERRLRLPSWAAAALRAWEPPRPFRGPPFIFRWRDGKSVWRVVDAAAARAGLGKLAPHDLRRTFASLALSSGIQAADLRRMMGHASISTTMRYDKRPDAAVLEEASKLDRLTRGPQTGILGGGR